VRNTDWPTPGISTDCQLAPMHALLRGARRRPTWGSRGPLPVTDGGGETDFRCAEREVDGYRCAHNHGASDGSRQAVTKKMTLAHKKAA